MLVTPEDEMRELLERIHATSASPLARDLAGTLMGLVAETFSGIYGNASKDTRWLSTAGLCRSRLRRQSSARATWPTAG